MTDAPPDPGPAITVASCGAGVQSTAIALLAADGYLPPLQHAIFADTGWEPQAVYDHLARLEAEVLGPAGIVLHRVSDGNLAELTVTPGGRFTNVPFYILAPEGMQVPREVPCPTCGGEGDPDGACGCVAGMVVDGTRPATRTEREGMGRRGCTSDHKVAPIKRKVRELLGYPHPTPVPAGVYAEQWIGISTDEGHRARDSDVRYSRHAFPLLDLKWSRADCVRYLQQKGWGSTPKSACLGCPFHGNRAWRDLRDNSPAEWAATVEFDRQLRSPEVMTHLRLEGAPFLHRSRVPLDEAPIDRDTSAALRSDQVDLFEALREVEWDESEEPPGCSPFTCRSDGL